MIPLPDNLVKQLLRHLPMIISCIDERQVDNKTYNAIRITRNSLNRIEKAINNDKRHEQDRKQLTDNPAGSTRRRD